MSRNLDDDFDADDLPGGSLDLETGSNVGHTGVAASYSGDGSIDFDDELDGDGPGGGGALELDIPGGSKHGPPSGPVNTRPPASQASNPPQSQSQPSRGPVSGVSVSGGPAVPDLAFDAPPSRPGAGSSGSPPAARSSGSLPATRPSGSLPAARSSGSLPAVQPGGPHSAPPAHSAPPPNSSSGRSLGGGPSAPPASEPSMYGGPPESSSGMEAGAPHLGAQTAPAPPAKATPAAVIAKYPAPPSGVLKAPMYAVRVVMRQLELRSELESLRRRRSPDVPLYEAALRAYDPKTFRLGVAINCALLTVATVIFFLPVILRFIRAD